MIESGKRQVIHEALLDFGSVGANSISTLNATVPQAKVGDPSFVVPPAIYNAIAAQGTLTLDTNVTDGNTMTVDAKVYTFQTTLTDVDGNIQIGGTLADTKANLVAAFDLSGVAGTAYAASMTAHPTVDIAAFIGDDAVLTAKVAGLAGDSIATTETFTAGTNVFDDTTLGATTAGVDAAAYGLIFDGQVTAASTVTVRAVNVTGSAIDPGAGNFKVVIWP